jgi:hypothetical protein
MLRYNIQCSGAETISGRDKVSVQPPTTAKNLWAYLFFILRNHMNFGIFID